MFTATLWVRGPDDLNWRVNARFTRSNCHDAVSRVHDEMRWYQARGYRVYCGPEAPEMPVPDYPILEEVR